MDALYQCTCPTCGGYRAPGNGGGTMPTPEMQKEAERIARGLYNGSITAGTLDPALTKLVADNLRGAVMQGFGKDLGKVDYDTPDYRMLSQLEKNVFHFSGAKNYQEIKTLSAALRDENGRVKEFKDFRKDALKVDATYNGDYLDAEHATAIGSGQMAGKWVGFEQDQAAADMLRYDTAHDGRVRPAHAKLDGVTRPVNDGFWKIYYPPNGWRCRCDVTQVLHAKATPTHEIQLPDDVPDMFKTNLAANGQAFPPTHPYYIDVPPNIIKKAEYLRDNVYSPVKTEPGMQARVYVSNKAAANDLDVNISLAKQLARHGVEVHIQPDVQADKGGTKNPELKLGPQTGDFKVLQPEKSLKNSVERNIKNAAAQGCNIPVLVIDKEYYNRLDVVRAFNNLFTNKEGDKKVHFKTITGVWIMQGASLIKITREMLATKAFYTLLP